MSLLKYCYPTNEKHSNNEILPSPAGSLSTFSLSFNTFCSNSSHELFRKERNEMKRKIILTPTQRYQVGKRADLALKETSVHITAVTQPSA